MGKSKFETEYSSTYKKHDVASVSALRSPVLKPRNVPPPILKYLDKVRGKENKPVILPASEAGLRSSDVHLVREPPLQHKTIAHHPRNHNIIPTKTTQHFEETPTHSERETLKEGKDKGPRKVPKMYNSYNIEDEFAGRPSDRLGYLAKEPPMQGKSCPPFHRAKVDHVSGSLMFDDPSSEEQETEKAEADAPLKKEKLQRKLDFKDPRAEGPKAREEPHLEKPRPPIKETFHSPKAVHSSPVKVQISPSKLQRKEDLKEVAGKQSERVNRALQIKAGLQNIEPPLHMRKEKTEYQREFGWKKPLKLASPVLSAENLIHKSDQILQAPIPVVSGLQKKTEYQTVYESPVLKARGLLRDDSKTKDNTSDAQSPAGLPSGEGLEDRNRERRSRNAEVKDLPPKPKQHFVTEYRGNYCSPKKFNVKDGAWIGDCPPQLKPERGKWESDSDKSDWFKEVIRLRQKAREFRARTEETHFPTRFGSPPSSISSRSASAVSVEADSLDEVEVRSTSQEQKTNDSQVAVPPRNSQDVPQNSRSDPDELKKKTVKANKTMIKPHIEDDSDISKMDAETDDENSSDDNATVSESLNGRLPTPRLKGKKNTRRHHLDPTTPAVGGVLLVSPTKDAVDPYRPSKPSRVAWVNMDENGIISDEPTSTHSVGKVSTQQTQRVKSMNGVGKKTANSSKPSAWRDVVGGRTYKVQKEGAGVRDNENGNIIRGGNYDFEKYTSPVQESTDDDNVTGGKRAQRTPLKDEPDHPLSPSSMSARSSVISDIHNRSVDRRNNFWT